jgi:hypothetical protein
MSRLPIRRAGAAVFIGLAVLSVAAKCPSGTSSPADTGHDCRIQEWHAPAKTHTANQTIIYGSLANYCIDTTKISHLHLTVSILRKGPDGGFHRTDLGVGITSATLTAARIPAQPENGVYTVSIPCEPGTYRLRGSIKVYLTTGQVLSVPFTDTTIRTFTDCIV